MAHRIIVAASLVVVLILAAFFAVSVRIPGWQLTDGTAGREPQGDTGSRAADQPAAKPASGQPVGEERGAGPSPDAPRMPSPGAQEGAAPPVADSGVTGGKVPTLLTREPLEVIGVHLAGAPVRREVQLAGRGPEPGLWAQPVAGEGSAQISFVLRAEAARLRGVAGLARHAVGGPPTAAPPQGAAVFRIYGDGNLLWESRTLSATSACEAFDVGVDGVALLALVAEAADPSRSPPCAWAELTLEGQKP